VESYEGKIAVVTGGANGIGRELVVQLAAAGCSVAACDVQEAALAETASRAAAAAPAGTRVTTHGCDVSDQAEVDRFRDEVARRHATAHVDLVFSNAGVGGGPSFVASPREEWDRTFAICWGGVYHCARAFVPLLIGSEEGCLVNTSSVNGFLAGLPRNPVTAYATAKFAVKGFTEALIEDFRMNAPHLRAVLVMPGHTATDFPYNTRRVLGYPEPDDMTADEIAEARRRMTARGLPEDALDDDRVKAMIKAMFDGFRDSAPQTPAQAAATILAGILAGEWRILVGDDAQVLDEAVRADPGAAYRPGGLDLGALLRPSGAGPVSSG
jgi:NAD(P)-dependent dehydrogenase (short-subunit alcohol dehydrogenase family)